MNSQHNKEKYADERDEVTSFGQDDSDSSLGWTAAADIVRKTSVNGNFTLGRISIT